MTELEPVPTAMDLTKMGLAHEEVQVTHYRTKSGARKTRTASWIVVHDEGHALLGEIMRRNAKKLRAAGVGDWTRPPSRVPGDTAIPYP